MSDLVEEVRTRLAALQPLELTIEDDSARHAGHRGNTGGGHLNLRVVSSHFVGKSRIMRHRIVYEALQDLIPARIHALCIEALPPEAHL